MQGSITSSSSALTLQDPKTSVRYTKISSSSSAPQLKTNISYFSGPVLASRKKHNYQTPMSSELRVYTIHDHCARDRLKQKIAESQSVHRLRMKWSLINV